MTNFIKFLMIKIIRFYQILISPYLGNNCRYLPTCSDYFIENIKENGTLKGSINGFKRILCCHPIKILGGGEGFDPVKKKK
tara:strand:+ start:531 stop:773 length:243 start_codon:yes stop_codon:yes gene_type:complete